MRLIVDSSVLVAANRTLEPHYVPSNEFLKQAIMPGSELACPALALGALVRVTGRQQLGGEATALIRHTVLLVPLSVERAENAATVAASCRLRGADARYVALAQELNATLITWHQEMLDRGGQVVNVLTPTQWLERIAGTR